MDREAWWATVYGVTKNQTRLSTWHTQQADLELKILGPEGTKRSQPMRRERQGRGKGGALMEVTQLIKKRAVTGAQARWSSGSEQCPCVLEACGHPLSTPHLRFLPFIRSSHHDVSSSKDFQTSTISFNAPTNPQGDDFITIPILQMKKLSSRRSEERARAPRGDGGTVSCSVHSPPAPGSGMSGWL